tara:strand:+ start:219 stop:554 length:336 start_codon:yes stop_codon:yes gene_type:complete
MATAKKKTPGKKKSAKITVSKEAAAAVVAHAPKARSKGSPRTGSHLKNLVRFREIDIDKPLSMFIEKVTARGGFEDPTEAAVAMLRYLAHYATKRGYGSFVPHVRKFRGKK